MSFQKKLPVILIILVCLLSVGCPGTKKTKEKFGTSGSQSGHQGNDEVFRQSMNVFDQLESHYGREMINQAMSRLDSWIAGMPEDKSWKESPYFTQIEEILTGVHNDLTSFRGVMKKIIGKEEVTATPQDVENAATLAKTTMDKIVTAYGALGVVRFIEIVEILGDCQKNLENFSTVSHQQNLSAARIGDFVRAMTIRQIPMEQALALLDHYLLALELFKESFRGRSLSLRGLDGDYIKQAVWFRNVSTWARGARQIDLERAKELFDWTIRNIAIKSRIVLPDGAVIPAMPQPAWQAMLYGQGTIADWVNVFVELLRQQRIDACVLGVIDKSAGIPRQVPWGVGVLIGNEIYIFFVELGLPLPEQGALELKPNRGIVVGKIATLSQLKANPSLLTFDGYNPLEAQAAKQIVENTTIFLSVDPITHSMRMKIMENELQGENKVVLHGSPSELRERIQKAVPDFPLAVWNYPFNGAFENCLTLVGTNTISSPSQAIQNAAFQISIRIQPHPLWRGRILYFANKISGEEGAANALQEARVTDSELSQLTHLDQVQYNVYRFATVTASYWLGTLTFNAFINADEDEADSTETRNYFQKQVLQNVMGDFWRNGATYYLGRIAEREGKYEEAIRFYSTDTHELDFSGRLLRSEILRKLAHLPPTESPQPVQSMQEVPLDADGT